MLKPPLLHLDHVQLAMPEDGEERARSFYRDLLGLEEVEKPAVLRGRGGCWFVRRGVHVHLGVDPDFQPATKAHVAFCVGDLDDLARRLLAAQRPVTWDEALPGRRRFYASDCFGNRLEFLADGDGLSQR
ncbi:MAG: VOC family protein [Acidobacteriota bacterium]